MISTRCLGAKQNAVKRLNHGDLMRYNLGVNGDSSIQNEDFLTGIQTLFTIPMGLSFSKDEKELGMDQSSHLSPYPAKMFFMDQSICGISGDLLPLEISHCIWY